MSNTVFFGALIVMIIVFLAYNAYFYGQYESIAAPGDSRRWNVVASYENNEDVAAAMARIHNKLMVLAAFLKKKYDLFETDDILARDGTIKDTPARKLAFYYVNGYNPDVVYENDPQKSTDTSYNLNKGEQLFLCMRKRDNPSQIEDDDILLFVILHELSHTIEKTKWGHEKVFWQTFKYLLQQAQEAGIYVPVDYSKDNKNFCGLNITYNPYFDSSLPNIEGA